MSDLTPERLAELQERAEAASPGEWVDFVLGSEGYAVLADNPGRLRRLQVARCGHEAWDVDKANAEHIAAFDPPTVLALLDEIDRLRKRVAAAEDVACLVGWTAHREETVREKALYELWLRWVQLPEVSSNAADWPHLSDEALEPLAARRDAARARRASAMTTTTDRNPA